MLSGILSSDVNGEEGRESGGCIVVKTRSTGVVDPIPVTFTLYHLVRLGVHSNLDVILLSGPSLIVV